MRALAQLATVVAVLLVAGLGALVIYIGALWMTNPLAQCLTVGAGVLFVGVASAISAGAREWGR